MVAGGGCTYCVLQVSFKILAKAGQNEDCGDKLVSSGHVKYMTS